MSSTEKRFSVLLSVSTNLSARYETEQKGVGFCQNGLVAVQGYCSEHFEKK